jgi:hypothetical protein
MESRRIPRKGIHALMNGLSEHQDAFAGLAAQALPGTRQLRPAHANQIERFPFAKAQAVGDFIDSACGDAGIEKFNESGKVRSVMHGFLCGVVL